MAEVIEVNGGYVVKLLQGRLPEYCGKDGYWTRDASFATPFELRATAMELASDLNDK